MNKGWSTLFLFLLFLAASPLPAAEQKPEAIAEKMAFKLVRGVTNVVTSPVEIPKQTVMTLRRHGAVGIIVGPVKGLGMMLYRGVMGITETVLFPVPQPGYYEPMVDPEFVWQEWDLPKKPTIRKEQQDGVLPVETEKRDGK